MGEILLLGPGQPQHQELIRKGGDDVVILPPDDVAGRRSGGGNDDNVDARRTREEVRRQAQQARQWLEELETSAHLKLSLGMLHFVGRNPDLSLASIGKNPGVRSVSTCRPTAAGTNKGEDDPRHPGAGNDGGGNDLYDFRRHVSAGCAILAESLSRMPTLDVITMFSSNDECYLILAELLERARQVSTLHIRLRRDLTDRQRGLLDRTLDGHPSMRNVQIHYDYAGAARGCYNPFPRSLSTLPKLESVSFEGLGAREYSPLIDFQPIRSPSLRKLSLSFFALDGQCNRALAGTLAGSPNLNRLRVDDCKTSTSNNRELCEAIGKATSLDILSIKCPSDSRFYANLARYGLRGKRPLKNLVLRACHDDGIGCGCGSEGEGLGHSLGMYSLSEVIKTTSARSITNLTLHSYRCDDLFIQGVRNLLAETASLQSLRLDGCSGLTDAGWHSVCDGISRNRAGGTLRKLDIVSQPSPIPRTGNPTPTVSSDQQQLTTLGFIRGVSALKNNRTLESLAFTFAVQEDRDRNAVEFSNALIGCVSELCGGAESRLKELEVDMVSPPVAGGFDDDEEDRLSSRDGKALVRALSNNFSLTRCPFKLGWSVPLQEQDRILLGSETILKLNQHGRRYLVEGRSKAKGVELLSTVADDLDCVYYHLRENPALCCETLSHTSNSAGVPSTPPSSVEPVPKRSPSWKTSRSPRKRAKTCVC